MDLSETSLYHAFACEHISLQENEALRQQVAEMLARRQLLDFDPWEASQYGHVPSPGSPSSEPPTPPEPPMAAPKAPPRPPPPPPPPPRGGGKGCSSSSSSSKGGPKGCSSSSSSSNKGGSSADGGGYQPVRVSGGRAREYYAAYYRAKGKGKTALHAFVQEMGPPLLRGAPRFTRRGVRSRKKSSERCCFMMAIETAITMAITRATIN